jgi:hypothetical protein
MVSFLLSFAVGAMLTGFAYWHRDRLLYIFSGVALIVLAGQFYALTDNYYIGLILGFSGVYTIFKISEKNKRVG